MKSGLRTPIYRCMRHILLAAILLCATPAYAQDVDNDPAPGDSLGQFFDGLRDQLAPLVEDLGPQLRGFADGLGPLIEELMGRIDDLSYYELPEVLPNGDIIIRRNQDAPELPPEGQFDI